MWPYWIIFLIFTILSLSKGANDILEGHTKISLDPLSKIILLLLTLFIGLRYQVGADWQQYLRIVERAEGIDLFSQMKYVSGEPGYQFIVWIGANIAGGIFFVNMVCAAIFSYGLLIYSNRRVYPWLSMVAATPFLITVVSIGYTRQSAAIGFLLIAFNYLQERKLYKYLIFVLLASFFHKTAVIMAPLAIAIYTINYKLIYKLVPVLILVSLIIYFGLKEHIDFLIYGYIELNLYDAKGLYFRLAMNIFPALIFLFWYKEFRLTATEKRIYLYLSIASMLFIPLSFIIPSTTVIDRLALYVSPIQLLVWSYIPFIFKRRDNRILIKIGIVIHSFAIMFVWLVFGIHAQYWIPYKNYFFEWIM